MLIDLLKRLEKEIVPPELHHHSITYCRYGSDDSGWKDKLGLHIWLPNKRLQTFFIEESEFQDVDGVITEIKTEIMKIFDESLPVSSVSETGLLAGH